MSSVNVACRNCGRILTVEEQLLGDGLLCPHCRQAVPSETLAPVDPAPEVVVLAPPPAFAIAAQDEESIFHAPEAGADALFGETETPRVEIPADLPEPLPSAATPSPEGLSKPLPLA